MSEKISFDKGKIIFKEGDKEYTFFKVTEGKVGIYKGYSTKYEKHLTDRTPGDIFGEMGIIEYRSRSATAVALEYTELEAYSDAEFDDFLMNNPDKMFEILDTMIGRIRELSNDNKEIRRDIKIYAGTEGANIEPSLLERIMGIVKKMGK